MEEEKQEEKIQAPKDEEDPECNSGDTLTENLKKYGVEDKEENQKVKDYISAVKSGNECSDEVISLDLFKEFGELKLCNQESNSINKLYNVRTAEKLESRTPPTKEEKLQERA